MKQFEVKVEYNPVTLDSAVDITFAVRAQSRLQAELGVSHLAQKLRSVGVDGLRVMEVQEVRQPPGDLL